MKRASLLHGARLCAGLLPAWLVGVSAPSQASVFIHGTTHFTVEVATPGIVEVRPGPAKVNRLLVVEGQRVAAGEVVAEIDTSDLDREMSALKDQVGTTRRRLDTVRLEAQSFGVLLEQGLVPQQRVTELETHLAELENSVSELMLKLATAEKRLANAEVRAPVAGVVGNVMLQAAGQPYLASQVMFRIASDTNAIVLAGHLSTEIIANLAATGEARVWLGALSFVSAKPLIAKLSWHEPHPSKTSAGIGIHAARLEVIGGTKALPAGVSLVPGQHVTVSLAEPKRALGNQLLDPIRRNLRLPTFSLNWRS